LETQLDCPKKGAAPNFRPMYCGQTAEGIKMPLRMEVGLEPDDIVLGILILVEEECFE